MSIDWQSVIVFLIVTSAILYGLRSVLRMLRKMQGRPGSSSCGSCGSCSHNGNNENRVALVSINPPRAEPLARDAPAEQYGERREDIGQVDIPPAVQRERPTD